MSRSDAASMASPSGKGKRPMDLFVVSARSERKVQDLQIRNGSLEAINRTLEKQLRKQSAELRRYKRLSRAGRLSVAPEPAAGGGGNDDAGEAVPKKKRLDRLVEEDDEEGGQDEDEEEDMSESDELSDEDDESDDDSGNLSEEAFARRRQRDERRLQLDLSKHQQLLVDSQKINQSLRRCLGWTEELIQEGKRALSYQVKVTEVKKPGAGAGSDKMSSSSSLSRGAVLNSREEGDEESMYRVEEDRAAIVSTGLRVKRRPDQMEGVKEAEKKEEEDGDGEGEDDGRSVGETVAETEADTEADEQGEQRPEEAQQLPLDGTPAPPEVVEVPPPEEEETRPAPTIKNPQDRDSGIELPADGIGVL